MKPTIIFRADGSSQIGLGHVVRSLALADMLKDNFECIFTIQQPGEALRQQIEETGIRIIVLPVTPTTGEQLISELDPFIKGNEIVVLDGYKFTTDYQRHIKEKGCALVCIDDIHAYHFVADVIINHSGGIKKGDYSTELYTQCYFGPQYALLRRPFLVKERDQPIRVENLFINMGGADPNNDLQKVMSILSSSKQFEELHVVTGSAYTFSNSLQEFIEADKRIHLYHGVSAQQMTQIMKNCGVAICPPSSVAYEYASVGGLLFLKQIAENQSKVKEYFLQEGMALDFDQNFGIVSSDNLHKLGLQVYENQKRLLDGRSDERLKAIFQKLVLASSITLRKAKEEDLMTCFSWANDPEVRRQSFKQETISIEEHTSWFKKKIKDAGTKFYIAEKSLRPIGLVRFEGDEKEQVISYLLASDMRGKGLGSVMLIKGIEHLVHEYISPKKISGYVKKANIASCKSFEKIGFIPVEQADGDSIKFEMTRTPEK